jgi:hypothetical protein
MVVGLHGANPQVGLRVHKVGFKGTCIDNCYHIWWSAYMVLTLK